MKNQVAVDPKDLSDTEIVRVIKDAADGCDDSIEAARRVKKAFSTRPNVEIRSLGEHQFGIIVSFPDHAHHSTISTH